MATKKETLTEDDTKCSICLLIFRNPRILPCKHMFCHDCLRGVVQGHKGESAFPCPLCRAATDTDIRINIDNADRVTTLFPVDREMQSHLERRQICIACKTENKNETATVYCMDCDEHMCKICGETHKKYKQMRNHQLLRSEEALSSKVRTSLKELSRCPNHENENVEYICQDHDQTCCCKCAFTSHRTCKVMLLSAVIIENKTYEASLKERTDMMDKALKRVSALCSELEREPLRVATTCCEKNMELQLSEIHIRIESAVNNLKDKVKKAFLKAKMDIIRSSEATLRTATAKKADIQNKKEELGGVLYHGNDVQKYLYMRSQPSSVDVDAAMQIEFTKKHIVLKNTPQSSSHTTDLVSRRGKVPMRGRGNSLAPRSPLAPLASRYAGKHTLLDYVLGEIKNLVEVKQEILK